jgi:hypothetical protein
MDVVRAVRLWGDRWTIIRPRLPHRGRDHARYDPQRHPVSSLALGPFGWTQTLNFMVVGLLTLAFTLGLVRLPGVRHKVGGSWSVSGESA